MLPSESLLDDLADQLVVKGYCVAESNLPSSLIYSLAEEIAALPNSALTAAGIGRLGDYQHNQQVRLDRIQWLTGQTSAQANYLKWMNDVRMGLNQRLFMGMQDFEAHFARYEPGAFYKKHFDAFRKQGATIGANRVLSTVLYLNAQWQETYGGELVIYAEDGDTVLERVLPYLGRIAIFRSEVFPHEVKSATVERMSIAGWFRTQGLPL